MTLLTRTVGHRRSLEPLIQLTGGNTDWRWHREYISEHQRLPISGLRSKPLPAVLGALVCVALQNGGDYRADDAAIMLLGVVRVVEVVHHDVELSIHGVDPHARRRRKTGGAYVDAHLNRY